MRTNRLLYPDVAESGDMKETDIIKRSFLQEVRNAAMAMTTANLNPDWRRAYVALADAADRLDAMQARAEVPEYMRGEPFNLDAAGAPQTEEVCHCNTCDCHEND